MLSGCAVQASCATQRWFVLVTRWKSSAEVRTLRLSILVLASALGFLKIFEILLNFRSRSFSEPQPLLQVCWWAFCTLKHPFAGCCWVFELSWLLLSSLRAFGELKQEIDGISKCTVALWFNNIRKVHCLNTCDFLTEDLSLFL